MKRPALFLDRDGVINVDHAYVYRKEDFHFVEGIFDLVCAAGKAGYLVVVVTNQAGIGRGYYSEADFHTLMDWVKGQFLQRGGRIDGVYFCPSHPQFGLGQYRVDSEDRKPRPGMIQRAVLDLSIDLKSSILIGDKSTDMEAGLAAGVGTLLCNGPKGEASGGTPIANLLVALQYFRPTNRLLQN